MPSSPTFPGKEQTALCIHFWVPLSDGVQGSKGITVSNFSLKKNQAVHNYITKLLSPNNSETAYRRLFLKATPKTSATKRYSSQNAMLSSSPGIKQRHCLFPFMRKEKQTTVCIPCLKSSENPNEQFGKGAVKKDQVLLSDPVNTHIVFRELGKKRSGKKERFLAANHLQRPKCSHIVGQVPRA